VIKLLKLNKISIHRIKLEHRVLLGQKVFKSLIVNELALISDITVLVLLSLMTFFHLSKIVCHLILIISYYSYNQYISI
jgi:hypothetical protein